MALNKKKREEKVLKSDQMIQEAIERGAVNPGTSSEVILGALNKELDKEKQTESQAIEKAPVEKKVSETVKPVTPPQVEAPAKSVVAEKEDVPKKSSNRGRKPIESPMERDFISVNVGDGVREDLAYLCRRHEKLTGKKCVGLGTYVRYLIEKDIAENQKYLDAAKAFEKEFV